MGSRHSDWPTGGPEKWLDEWQEIMRDCERWAPALYSQWAKDFRLVWSSIPDVAWLCREIWQDIEAGNMDWDIYWVSNDLQRIWDE